MNGNPNAASENQEPQQPKLVAKVEMFVFDNGAIQISGPLQNKVLCMQMAAAFLQQAAIWQPNNGILLAQQAPAPIPPRLKL